MPKRKARVNRRDVQGNILVGFNKPNVQFIFLKFGENKLATALWLGKVARRLPSTDDLLEANEKMNREIDQNPNYRPQETWIHVSLSKSGIEYFDLRIPPSSGVYSGVGPNTEVRKDSFEKDAVFQPIGSVGPFMDGMKSPRWSELLGDIFGNAPDSWDEPFRLKEDGSGTRIDALLIIAADQEDDLSLYTSDTISEATRIGASIVGREVGRALTNEQGKQVEHFGFRDGLSQPLIVGVDKRDIDTAKSRDWLHMEDFVLFDLDDDLSWANNGSFLVFRKLEQDVEGFWNFMNEQCSIGVLAQRPEDLAAILIGRWRSGAPLANHKFDPILPGYANENNFMYLTNGKDATTKNDPEGDLTSTFAHIRWANPRDWSRTGYQKSSKEIISDNQQHRILRRGIPYGAPLSRDFARNTPDDERISRGLLFVCYQRDIEKQYVFVQNKLSVDDNFPQSGKHQPIMDMLKQKPDGYIRKGIDGWITVKGGEYFFSPSISFLLGLRNWQPNKK